MLPDGWRLAKLSDLVSNPNNDIVDGPFGSNLKASEYVDKGITIIRLQNIDRNNFLNKNLKYITNEKARELKRHNFSSGDIVITKLGSPLGKACLVPPYLDWGIIVADVVRVRPNDDLVLREYLVHAINSDFGIRQFEPLVKGTTRPRVNLGNIRDLNVPVPSLETQRRIVATLDKAEETRRLRAQADALNDLFVWSIFKNIFGDLGKNTDLWKQEKLEDICIKITDGVHNVPPLIKDGTPILMARNIQDGHIDLTDVSYISSEDHAICSKRCNPVAGDVLLVCIGATIGRVAIVPEMDEFSLVRNVALLKPNLKKIMSEYLLWCLKTGYMQSQLLSRRNASAQDALYLNKIKNIRIPLPPLYIQQKFSKFLNLSNYNRKIMDKSSKEIDALFESLLQKAFSGELVT